MVNLRKGPPWENAQFITYKVKRYKSLVVPYFLKIDQFICDSTWLSQIMNFKMIKKSINPTMRAQVAYVSSQQ